MPAKRGALIFVFMKNSLYLKLNSLTIININNLR